jgi:hypothetical protein
MKYTVRPSVSKLAQERTCTLIREAIFRPPGRTKFHKKAYGTKLCWGPDRVPTPILGNTSVEMIVNSETVFSVNRGIPRGRTAPRGHPRTPPMFINMKRIPSLRIGNESPSRHTNVAPNRQLAPPGPRPSRLSPSRPGRTGPGRNAAATCQSGIQPLRPPDRSPTRQLACWCERGVPPGTTFTRLCPLA